MNWRGIWHLGTRYLRRKRIKTMLMIAAFTLVWLLPSLVGLVVGEAERHLRSRANETPLLIGRSGSPLELVFNGLYFTKPDQATFPYGESRNLGEELSSIPVYARFSAGDDRIIGTSVDYFHYRKIRFSGGRGFVRIGECVLGSAVAKKNELGVGDSIISSPGSMFDLAGVYPLKMKICGIMDTTGSPDDHAIFVDLKTCWVIEGLGHGHEDAREIGPDGRLLSKEDDIKLNASVVHYNEVTAENATNFHFHGDQNDFPISAAIMIPETAKAQAMLKGDFQQRNDMQIISPAREMDELFTTVFRIQKVVSGILVLIGLATLMIGFLVFLLSHRLRLAEFTSLSNMGADPMFLRWLIAFEALFVMITSILAAGGILLIVKWILPILVRNTLV